MKPVALLLPLILLVPPQRVAIRAPAAAPPAGPTLYAESGWENGERSDNGFWSSEDCGASFASYLTAETSEGAINPVSGSYMLRVRLNGSVYCYVRRPTFVRSGDDDTYLRFYITHLTPSMGSCCFHGIQDFDEGSGSSNFYFRIVDYDTTDYSIGYSTYVSSQGDFYSTGSDFSGCGGEWDSESQVRLTYGDWYRVEIHIQWLETKASAGATILEMRVYDDGANLVVDNSNIETNCYDGSFQTADTMDNLYGAEERALYLDGTSVSLFVGTNGPLDGVANPWFLIDAVAFSAEDWIGACTGDNCF